MFNFTKTNKSELLNDNLRELENRFQERIDEHDKYYKLHIQKLDEKLVVLEEKHKITYELMDKLYDYRFQEINNNIWSNFIIFSSIILYLFNVVLFFYFIISKIIKINICNL